MTTKAFRAALCINSSNVYTIGEARSRLYRRFCIICCVLFSVDLFHLISTTVSNNRFYFFGGAPLQQQTELQLLFGCCQQQTDKLVVEEPPTIDLWFHMSDFNIGEGRFPVYTDWLICIHFFLFLQRQRTPLQTQSLLSLPGEYARMQWRDRFARFWSRTWCFHVDFRTMICFFSPSLQRFHFFTMKGFRNCVIAYLVPFRNRPAVLSGF